MKQLPLSTNIFISDYDLTSEQPVYRNKTNDGRTSIKSQQYQIYSGSIDLHCVGEDAVKTLQAFMMSLNGGVEPLSIKLPNMKTANVISGAPALHSAYNKNTKEVQIDNFSGEFKAGDFIQFMNDPKLYMLLTTGTAGSVFEISPSLRTDKPAGSRITTDVYLTARLDDDTFKITPNKTIKSLKIELKFREDL